MINLPSYFAFSPNPPNLIPSLLAPLIIACKYYVVQMIKGKSQDNAYCNGSSLKGDVDELRSYIYEREEVSMRI